MGFIGQVQRTNRRFSGGRSSTRRTAVRVIASRPVQRVVRSASPSHIAHGVLSSHGVQRAARGGAKQVRVQRQAQAAAQRKSQQQSQRKQIAVNLLNQSSHGVRLPKTSVPKTVFNTKIAPTGIAKQAAQQAAKYQPQQSSQVKVRASRLKEQAGTSLPKPKLSTPPPAYGKGKNGPHAFRVSSKDIGRYAGKFIGVGPEPKVKTPPKGAHTFPAQKPHGPEPLARVNKYYPSEHSGVANFEQKFVKTAAAPVIKVLDVANRPYAAEAGAITAGLKGHNVLHAAARGIQGKEHKTFSDVVGAATGMKPGLARDLIGLGVGIAADPTTHGAASLEHVATKSAAKSAARVERKVVKADTRAQKTVQKAKAAPAKRASKKAGKATKRAQNLKAQAQREAHNPTRGVKAGVTVRVPFKHKPLVNVRTSGRATSAVARGVKKSAKARNFGGKARTALNKTISPATTPAFRSVAEHRAIRDEVRIQKGTQQAADHAAARKLKAYDAAVPKASDRAAIRHAVETSTEHLLSKDLRPVAESFKRDNALMLAEKKRVGLLKEGYKPKQPGDATGYMPHVNQKVLDKTGAPTFTSGKVPGKEHQRGISGTVHDINHQAPGLFVEDPKVANAISEINTGRKTSQSDMWRKIADRGKPYNEHTQILDSQHERVYKVTPRGLKELSHADGTPDLHAMQAALSSKERHVVLDKRSVENVKGIVRQIDEHAPGRVYDKAQGHIKHAMTVNPLNPGFQLRNLQGDMTLGWQVADTGVRDLGQSRRVGHSLHARNKYEQSAEAVTQPGPLKANADKLLAREVKTPTGTYTHEDLIGLMEKHGVINTGQYGGEVRAQLGGVRLTRRGKVKDQGRLNRFNAARENFPRIATFINGLKRGLSPNEAARLSLSAHIDYNELTSFERDFARRVVPFYTFFARNTAIQAKTLLKRPGKIATIAKVYDVAAKQAGFNSYQDYVQKLPQQQQAGLPMPIRFKGTVYPVFVSPVTTDLNQVTLDPTQQFQNFANRVTFFKMVPELLANYSVFFRGKIQDPNHPTVVAPSMVASLPGPIKNALGVRKILDKKTGKMVWGWDAKADYAFRALPQTNFAIAASKPTADARGPNGIVRTLGYLSGIRVGNPDTATINQVSNAYQKLNDVKARLGALRQQGYSATRPNSEYKGLLQQQRQLLSGIYNAQKQAGYKVLPKTGAPPKGRAPSSSGDGTGGSGAGDGTGGLGTGMSKTRLHGPGVKLASLEAQYVKGVGFVNPQAAGQLAANAGAKQAGRTAKQAAGILASSAVTPGASRYQTVGGKVRLFAHPQRPGAGQLGKAQLALTNQSPTQYLHQITTQGGKDKTGKVVLHPQLARKLVKSLRNRGYGDGQIVQHLTRSTPLKKLGQPHQLVVAGQVLKGVKHTGPGVPSGVPKQYKADVAKYGSWPGVQAEAKKWHLTGPELLAKIAKGESGFIHRLPNGSLHTSGLASGLAQFTPGNQAAYKKKYGVDVYADGHQAFHGMALYMIHQGGLAGYNRGGGQTYLNYILGQQVGKSAPTVKLTAKQKQAVKIVERAHKAGQKIPKNLRHFVTQNMPTPGVTTSNPTSTSTSGVSSPTSSPSSSSSTGGSGGKAAGAGPTSTSSIATTAGFTQQELQALQLLGLDPSVLSSLGLQTGYSPSTGSMKLPKTAPVRVRALSRAQEKSALV